MDGIVCLCRCAHKYRSLFSLISPSRFVRSASILSIPIPYRCTDVCICASLWRCIYIHMYLRYLAVAADRACCQYARWKWAHSMATGTTPDQHTNAHTYLDINIVHQRIAYRSRTEVHASQKRDREGFQRNREATWLIASRQTHRLALSLSLFSSLSLFLPELIFSADSSSSFFMSQGYSYSWFFPLLTDSSASSSI